MNIEPAFNGTGMIQLRQMAGALDHHKSRTFDTELHVPRGLEQGFVSEPDNQRGARIGTSIAAI